MKLNPRARSLFPSYVDLGVARPLRFPGWHSLAPDRTTRRAAAGLARRGCIEIAGDQFRFHRT